MRGGGLGANGGRTRAVAVEAILSDMAATKRKQSPSKRAKRSLMASRPSLPRPRLEPHHVDILALAMIAVGIFLAGVAYLGWSGGTLGDGAIRAIRFVLGRLGDIIPAALVVGGALVLLRELRPPGRPMRTGLIVLSAAIMLALAAGTLGLGPDARPRRWPGTRRRSKRAAESSARPSCGSAPA